MSTFFRHQSTYLWPLVINRWRMQQQPELLEEARQREGGLYLEGDGRSDSPGKVTRIAFFTH